MDEEMIAGEHMTGKTAGRIRPPGIQAFAAGVFILQPAKSRDGTGKRGVRLTGIALADGEISPEDGHDEHHEFRVGKHLFRGPIQTLDFHQEFWFGQ